MLDLTVGMKRTPDGFVEQHEGDARTHYSWLPTRAYRDAFGLLTYRDALPAFQPAIAEGPRSVGVQINGNDHYLDNVIVFDYAHVGVQVNGAANVLTTVHTWNGGGVGIGSGGTAEAKGGCAAAMNAPSSVGSACWKSVSGPAKKRHGPSGRPAASRRSSAGRCTRSRFMTGTRGSSPSM